MGMLVEGLNKIADIWSNLNTAGEIGTGTTQETAQDTDLVTPISGSETTDIGTGTANQFLKQDVTFTGTSAASEAVTEMIWKTQSPELASSRITHGSVTWSTTSDLVYETRWYFQGRTD